MVLGILLRYASVFEPVIDALNATGATESNASRRVQQVWSLTRQRPTHRAVLEDEGGSVVSPPFSTAIGRIGSQQCPCRRALLYIRLMQGIAQQGGAG
jgi:hypothetical protein